MDITTINLGLVNAYLVKAGGGFVLVDTGLPGQWPQLEAALNAAGCLPDKLRLVVITHGDWDHIGNCFLLQQRYNAKIAMHPADVPMAKDGLQLERTIRPLMFKILFALMKLRRRDTGAGRFTPDIMLSDGQRLDGYGLAASILHLPGHTPGSIGLVTDDGAFFAGDIVSNRWKPDYAEFVHDLQELRASIGRIKTLKIKTVYPGHGQYFPAERLADISI